MTLLSHSTEENRGADRLINVPKVIQEVRTGSGSE